MNKYCGTQLLTDSTCSPVQRLCLSDKNEWGVRIDSVVPTVDSVYRLSQSFWMWTFFVLLVVIFTATRVGWCKQGSRLSSLVFLLLCVTLAMNITRYLLLWRATDVLKATRRQNVVALEKQASCQLQKLSQYRFSDSAENTNTRPPRPPQNMMQLSLSSLQMALNDTTDVLLSLTIALTEYERKNNPLNTKLRLNLQTCM